jgi:hypothetical protein
MFVDMCGGGGGGAGGKGGSFRSAKGWGGAGGGGGGAALRITKSISVVPGETLTMTVGAAGTGGAGGAGNTGTAGADGAHGIRGGYSAIYSSNLSANLVLARGAEGGNGGTTEGSYDANTSARTYNGAPVDHNSPDSYHDTRGEWNSYGSVSGDCGVAKLYLTSNNAYGLQGASMGGVNWGGGAGVYEGGAAGGAGAPGPYGKVGQTRGGAPGNGGTGASGTSTGENGSAPFYADDYGAGGGGGGGGSAQAGTGFAAGSGGNGNPGVITLVWWE